MFSTVVKKAGCGRTGPELCGEGGEAVQSDSLPELGLFSPEKLHNLLIPLTSLH